MKNLHFCAIQLKNRIYLKKGFQVISSGIECLIILILYHIFDIVIKIKFTLSRKIKVWLLVSCKVCMILMKTGFLVSHAVLEWKNSFAKKVKVIFMWCTVCNKTDSVFINGWICLMLRPF